MDKGIPHRKPARPRMALAILPLVAWWLALAIWLTIGGGFGAIQRAPYSAMPIMAIGTMVVVVLCMSLGGWGRRGR